ncbi:Peptidase A1 domain-containing protein [Mycena venus]|uniref:Peptidase A1 domain-containing protein n=1 Tax=Mycena venus TaxID=2733690 RepID=A0A8H6YZ94_9AGAR|nr:Peptidase A1 domain-containing protein [Mycena venus]
MLAIFQHALRVAPTAAKYITTLLLLLNAGSFPFVWHIRVLSAVFEQYLALQWHRLSHFYLGKEKKREALIEWYEGRQPIGVHPFRAVWTYRRWVGFDDGDFYLHMSNSSYAKALDSARFRLALATFPNLFRCGGWVALAATHFHFVREIPVLSAYEVRTTVESPPSSHGSIIWCISRFVKPPSKTTKSISAQSFTDGLVTQQANEVLEVNRTPDGIKEADAVTRALLERAARATESDGAMLYTVAVSQLCYKHGRITVPPAIVLAANGFYAAPAADSTLTSSSAGGGYPHYWPAVRTLTASMPALAKFYAGGWRDVPEGGRWWEDAFMACEAERLERLVPFVGSEMENEGLIAQRRGGLAGGLEGVRRLV